MLLSARHTVECELCLEGPRFMRLQAAASHICPTIDPLPSCIGTLKATYKRTSVFQHTYRGVEGGREWKLYCQPHSGKSLHLVRNHGIQGIIL
jgi:hypothetical protein